MGWAWAGLLLGQALAAASPLDYRGAAFEARIVSVSTKADHVEYEVTFPSPVKSPFKANDTVWVHLLLPRLPGPRPGVMVLPIMAAPNVWIEKRFMRRLLKDGFAVLWLETPYQFHRRPLASVPSGQVFLARTAPRLAANFRQSVLDAQRALDWFSRQPAVDASRIGLFGISLGALVGSSVYSVDPRPKYAVFLLGGADYPDLLAGSSMTGPFLRKNRIPAGVLRAALSGLDPLEFRDGNKGKKALLINVRSDTVIPAANALKLREAFPDSRQLWLPFGHYSAILHLIWIPAYVSKNYLLNL